ncbi:MAG: N-acetylmuramoyl-L-alanine amidase [Bifidobacteriaceae bacterium]|jgi:N-acetyl-anhydromuramyl-L-alanine amidase AmpD|nr:N-acetylmuramoyl-L-alanine amidase [Bifidobacteriaceae bacterium]
MKVFRIRNSLSAKRNIFAKAFALFATVIVIIAVAVIPSFADSNADDHESGNKDLNQFLITTPDSDPDLECPSNLNCQFIAGQSSHSNTDRTRASSGPQFKYIVIHDTEEKLARTLDLIQSPDYGASWNYTADVSGVYQHFNLNDDLCYHAGNFYFNMHAIGIENIGFVGGGGWYTDKIYKQTADLVRYLAKKYNIPLDKGHIIGHENIPGIDKSYTQNVHKDPGPFWDWNKFFEYLGEPFANGKHPSHDFSAKQFALINPTFSKNLNTITNASFYEYSNPDIFVQNYNYAAAPTSFTYVYSQPNLNSPLANDPAYTSPDRPINTDAESVPGRAYSGDIVYIKEVKGDWLKIQWAGNNSDGDGWIYNPKDKPVAVHIATKSAALKPGLKSASTYGRAYPDDAAYSGTGVNPQPRSPLEYELKPGIEYPIADMNVVSDYYSSTDKKEIVGNNKYYAIYLGHHFVFINADDVIVKDNPLPKPAPNPGPNPNPEPYPDFGINVGFLTLLDSLLVLAVIIIVWQRHRIKVVRLKQRIKKRITTT